MHPIIRNVLAVIAGLLLGHTINFYLVQWGHSWIPVEGVDLNNMEELVKVMPTLEAKHFVFPFLAHALGALLGAFLTGVIAATHKMKLALVIGAVFFTGGIAASILIPAPTWFMITDLLLAYFPMAWIGGKLASGNSGN